MKSIIKFAEYITIEIVTCFPIAITILFCQLTIEYTKLLLKENKLLNNKS